MAKFPLSARRPYNRSKPRNVYRGGMGVPRGGVKFARFMPTRYKKSTAGGRAFRARKFRGIRTRYPRR